MAKGPVVRSSDPGKRRSRSEFMRGYNYTKGVLKGYRSLWIEDGYIWGYTLKGVKHKMFPVGDLNCRTNNFDGGSAKALREGLKEKPKRKLNRSLLYPIRTNIQGRPLALNRMNIF